MKGTHGYPHSPRASGEDEDEERKALISSSHDRADPDLEDACAPPSPTWRSTGSGSAGGSRLGRRRNGAVCAALLLSVLLLTAALPYRGLFLEDCDARTRRVMLAQGGLKSNGTEVFRKTAVIVSIDGLRADYLDRGLTPHLLAISKDGLRAKSMKPVFPTLTFPNHWALMTGLYAESHGIVGNNFWDPVTNEEFHYNREESTWVSRWWHGEPMWETAEKAGIVTANLMWPGPPRTTRGVAPTYFVPWKDKVPMQAKLDQILAWIDLPLEKRPQLITAYEPSLDQAGHKAGPTSKLVNQVLKEVDVFARDLHDQLEARNLTDIVDVVFVSDHGMTDTSQPEFIYMDDILGEGWNHITHEDGWPAMGFRFDTPENADKYYRVLQNASAALGGKFSVYNHSTMPERWHFVANERIAPIYVVPEIEYALTDRVENGAGLSKGNHGYDNNYKEMHAMFVAHGPFAAVVKAVHADRLSSALASNASLLEDTSLTDGWDSISGDAYVMETFENVQVYNLMMKLLGIEDHAAPTNGTKGFWDKYF